MEPRRLIRSVLLPVLLLTSVLSTPTWTAAQ